MIRDVIESFGFMRVTNSKYIKRGVTLWLDAKLNIMLMTVDYIRIIKVKDILGAHKSIENFLKHAGEL